NEILQARILVFVSFEIRANAVTEVLGSDKVARLLHHRSAFSVSDAVKRREGLVGVLHRIEYRVSGDELIFGVGPLFGAGVKGLPSVSKLGGLDQGESGHVGRETFVQP